jgi:hypothetical protein
LSGVSGIEGACDRRGADFVDQFRRRHGSTSSFLRGETGLSLRCFHYSQQCSKSNRGKML